MNFNKQFDNTNETIIDTYSTIRYILSYSYSINNFILNLAIDGICTNYHDEIFTFKVRDITFTNLNIFTLLKDDFWTTQNLISNMGYNLNPARKIAAGR